MDTGQHGIQDTMGPTDIGSAREMLMLCPPQMLNQWENLMPMPGSITLLMDTGQHGIQDTMGPTDIGSAKEVLMLSQKENLTPMPGSITLPMDITQHGTTTTDKL